MSENTVTLSLAAYNQIKAENTRFQMLISRIMEDTRLKNDCSGLQFESEQIANVIKLVYPDMYKKKLATLRTMHTKEELKKNQY